MSKWINGRVGAALCLAGVLMATNVGCHPAGSSGPAASSNKPGDPKAKPDPKNTSPGVPPHDPG